MTNHEETISVTVSYFKKMELEISVLRAKLEKAEKVIDAFHKGLTQVNKVPIDFADACAALRELQAMGETK